jgi:hypothetical protein
MTTGPDDVSKFPPRLAWDILWRASLTVAGPMAWPYTKCEANTDAFDEGIFVAALSENSERDSAGRQPLSTEKARVAGPGDLADACLRHAVAIMQNQNKDMRIRDAITEMVSAMVGRTARLTKGASERAHRPPYTLTALKFKLWYIRSEMFVLL